MAREFPFAFDFDEDADPVEELHRLRVASMKHFKTLDAVMEYHRSLPPIKELLAEIREEIAEEKAKAEAEAAPKRKPKAVKKPAPARRRKAEKRLTTA